MSKVPNSRLDTPLSPLPPDGDEKDAIWQLYLSEFSIDAKQTRPSDDQWIGAEIKACCRLASLLREPLVQARQDLTITPVGFLSFADSLFRRGYRLDTEPNP